MSNAREILKSRILISCGARTIFLAQKLQDQLQTDFCEAVLWNDDGGSQSSAAILEMLNEVAEQFDFAVIILAKEDVTVTKTDDTLRARDTSAFQAGLFMAKLGQTRCFLVNSIGQSVLPSHLGGITPIPFDAPADLADPSACANAIAEVAVDLKGRVQQMGRSPYYIRVPNLSIEEVWQRERHHSEGGDLQEGEVIVCDNQPMPQEEFAVQVRSNMDQGISYTYFLYFCVDTIEKLCQSLQVIAVAGVAGVDYARDFTARISFIKDKASSVLDDLERICRERRLRVTLLVTEPTMSFRIHNASNRELATLYARYRERCFIPWANGSRAEAIWRNLPLFIADEEQGRLLVSMKAIHLNNEREELLESSLDRALRRYFPGLESRVKQLMIGVPA